METKKNYCINCMFLGESGVGKTSIIRRLIGQGFEVNMLPTTAIEKYFFKEIKCLNDKDSEITIKILDTAGQERYHSTCKGVVQKADIIIFVRDNIKENFDYWFGFVKDIIDISSKKVIYCLNKTDLISEKEKEKIFDELQDINVKKEHKAAVQCVSSKSSDGIFNLKSLIKEKSREIISNELQRNRYNINIILIGGVAVGKSSLIERIINDHYELDSQAPTFYTDIKQAKVDLKNHSSINFKYFDVSGQENNIHTWIHYLDNVDIIIFVNNKDSIKINTSKIEKRVLLSDKKVICCLNKKDLISDAENEQILKSFKEANDKLIKYPILSVSAKTSDGIEELKSQILKYSLDIIEVKKNELKNQNYSSSIERRESSFNLEPSIKKNKNFKDKDKSCSC